MRPICTLAVVGMLVLLCVAVGAQTPDAADTSDMGPVLLKTFPPHAQVYKREARSQSEKFGSGKRASRPDRGPGSVGLSDTRGGLLVSLNVAQYVLVVAGHQDTVVTLQGDTSVTATLPPDTVLIGVQDHLLYDPVTQGFLVVLVLVGVGFWWYFKTHRVVQSDTRQASFINHTVDGYLITEKLGEGGFSVVYKAVRTGTEEQVAIKVLKREYLDQQDSDVLNRFHRETMVQLIHPNVVTTLSCGEYMLRPYIVLEYIEGSTLRSLLQPRLDPGPALHLFMQMGRGLGFAHERGYVHRDLKPENIMITRGGRVKIMDFGIAKHVNKPGATRSATTMGTPRYMSPEHLDSKSTDARADIYSMGVILFEILTGRTPFEGELMEQISAHLFSPPPRLTDLDPNLPVELADLVGRMLMKSAAERYQTMGEVLDAVQGAADRLHLPLDQAFELPSPAASSPP